MVIYYRRTEERKSFVRKVLSIHKDEISNKKRILVKPNIVSIEEYPTTTNPDTLDAVLSFLSQFDNEIIVGDGPAVGKNKKMAIKYHTLKDICARYNVSLINFHNEKKTVRSCRNGKYKLKMSNIPFNCDYIISLPILKTHRLGNIGMSCSLKNQFGYLSNWNRIKYHINVKAINRCIAEINAIIKTDLFIADAVEVLLNANEIRHGGYKAELGYMFAGKDPVALDSYGLKLLSELGEKKLLQKKPSDIEYIRLARDYDLGDFEYELVNV